MPKKMFTLLLVAAVWAAGEVADTREVPTTADVVRFLEQATWGPTPDLIAHVQQVGFETFLEEQFSAEVSGYPNMELVPTKLDAITCPNGSPCQCS